MSGMTRRDFYAIAAILAYEHAAREQNGKLTVEQLALSLANRFAMDHATFQRAPFIIHAVAQPISASYTLEREAMLALSRRRSASGRRRASTY